MGNSRTLGGRTGGTDELQAAGQAERGAPLLLGLPQAYPRGGFLPLPACVFLGRTLNLEVSGGGASWDRNEPLGCFSCLPEPGRAVCRVVLVGEPRFLNSIKGGGH